VVSSSPVERALLEVRNGCYDAEGRFRPEGETTPIDTWARARGYTAPGLPLSRRTFIDAGAQHHRLLDSGVLR